MFFVVALLTVFPLAKVWAAAEPGALGFLPKVRQTQASQLLLTAISLTIVTNISPLTQISQLIKCYICQNCLNS